ncbi:Na-K-Cl cotransporter [Salinibacter altiplanensis]|uniref:Na-K-Cl cotransporter n=1 Tax=Salinibacter altiplanensis TaxID=1803181 RepID=UPI000C9FC579|nr:Na-K-Cl cotransporter [Salinibacter altiplanensis]
MKPDLDTLQRSAEADQQEVVASGKPGGLGMFGGVFTPSILTILGVIMYLRFGWVVGNAGLLGTLLIVTISTGITFLTALSIAAIATDQRVRVGGAYYMISRSLGIEIGGAVGIPLYIAQGLSVALYTVGFAESMVNAFPALQTLSVLGLSGIQMVGIVITILVAVLALGSPNVAIKAQYFILAAIVVSLVSLVAGRPVEPSDIQMWGATGDTQAAGFWEVFAVFFPAVTGIMAGVNLSGDLEDPNTAIPWGTFGAVGVGYLVYMALPLLLGLWANSATLIEDTLIMRRMAWWGDAILLGVWGATLSSAIGSILGAPRVLQALALDGVLPSSLKWLGKGAGEENIPRSGTVLTLGLALGAVMTGNLNAIAPVLTMFFLTTYAVLNVAAGVETFLDSPSFRPEFKVHWSLSLLGAAGCTAVMFLINWWATLIAIVFVGVVFAWLQRRSLRTAWGDVRQGLWMSLTRAGLLHLNANQDPKNWRPHILVLSGAPRRRWPVIELASALTHNQALMTVGTVLRPSEASDFEKQQEAEATLREYLSSRGVQSLVRTTTAEDPFAGGERLIEDYGLGVLKPNTIMLGDTEDSTHHQRFCTLIEHLYAAHRNVVVLRGREQGFGDRARIDVWWSGLKGNGGLMKILAYLLQTSLEWQGAQVRVNVVATDTEEAEERRRTVAPILDQLRTGATLNVIEAGGRVFDEIVHDTSADADIVFLGMATPEEEEDYASYYTRLLERTAGLPPTVFVLAAEDISFREVLA